MHSVHFWSFLLYVGLCPINLKKGPSSSRQATPYKDILLNDIYALLNNLPRENVDLSSYVRCLVLNRILWLVYNEIKTAVNW